MAKCGLKNIYVADKVKDADCPCNGCGGGKKCTTCNHYLACLFGDATFLYKQMMCERCMNSIEQHQK